MTITLNVTKAELQEVADIYGSLDSINSVLNLPTIGYKEKLMMALGKEYTVEEGFMKAYFNKHGMYMEVQVPEPIMVAVFEVYSEMIKQTVPPIMALVTAFKMNVEPKLDKLQQAIEEHS